MPGASRDMALAASGKPGAPPAKPLAGAGAAGLKLGNCAPLIEIPEPVSFPYAGEMMPKAPAATAIAAPAHGVLRARVRRPASETRPADNVGAQQVRNRNAWVYMPSDLLHGSPLP